MAKLRHRLLHDQRVLLLALGAGAPAVLVMEILLWTGDYTTKVQWTLTLIVVGFWLGYSFAARERVIRPLQTAANLLSALREGDFSVRARGARRDDPLGDVMFEINQLGSLLQEQRLGALEATALLRTVMEEIDVAIFAFDHNETLRLVNRAGQELIVQPAERILGRSAAELDLQDCLAGAATRVISRNFPGGTGRWGMRRTSFREGGLPHSLVVIADLSQPLREEELEAWQRLVRVLGHELNNSLAPIKSIAGSLSATVKRTPRAPDWEDDLRAGLEIIETRAQGLNRFMQSYTRLAKLPPPVMAPVDLAPLVLRVASMETRLVITVLEGPPVTARLDAAQIEQVIINLLKNAVDASLDQPTATGSPNGVRVTWRKTPGHFELSVEDDGPGVANPQNLFVPFFTTKPSGSGIGLVLCRQIVENHGGTLMLENRTGANGCVARLRLPL
ncbi:MAG: ATP-binding protein [Opitutaceae bacterium]|nr:ATP-binding protein [Opitutaceae bacterium]